MKASKGAAPKFTVSKSQSKSGKFTFKIFMDGKLLGSRSSNREYKYSLLTIENRNSQIASIQYNIPALQAQVKEYSAITKMSSQEFDTYNLKTARPPHRNPRTGEVDTISHDWDIKCHRKFFDDGEYNNFLKSANASLSSAIEKIAALKADTSPLKISVYSFHGSLKSAKLPAYSLVDQYGIIDLTTGAVL